MQYFGGKARMAKKISLAITNELKIHQYNNYVEPFCGASNVYQYVQHPSKIALDSNRTVERPNKFR